MNASNAWPAQRATGPNCLPDDLPDDEYLSRFMQRVGDRIRVRIADADCVIDGRLFLGAQGESKLRKRGRHRFVEFLADAALDPDEVYEVSEADRTALGNVRLRRRHLRSFDGIVLAVVVFEFNAAEAAFVGVTAFFPVNSRGAPDQAYFGKQKTGLRKK